MLPLRVWIGSYGQDTHSAGKYICSAQAAEEKIAVATQTSCVSRADYVSWLERCIWPKGQHWIHSSVCWICPSVQPRLSLVRHLIHVGSGGFMNGMWVRLFPFIKVLVFSLTLSLSFFFFALTFFVVYIPVCHRVMESACQAEWNNPNWMDWRLEKHVLLCNLGQAHMYGCKHTHWKH